MKKIIIFIVLAIASINVANAASNDYVKDGNTFCVVGKQSPTNQLTPYTYEDAKCNKHIIYMTSTGSCYIKKVSTKTGNEYRQYLGEEISREVCKQMNREYKPKSKTNATNN